MPKKLAFSFLSFLILFSSIAPNFLLVKAQVTGSGKAVNENPPATTEGGSWYDQSFWDWHGKVYNPEDSSEIFGERYTAAQVQWVIFGLFSQILHVGGPKTSAAIVCVQNSSVLECAVPIGDAIKSFSLISDSQTGPAKTVLSFFDSQPLSGIGYFHQKINNFHLIPEVSAQGTGFSAANPIQTLWVAFRNLTFGLMVIVVLIMAFMIMFRVKISPQAVITVQSALPKVAGALILITFSYAIAGFMIDIMYLVMGIMASFLASSNISTLGATEVFKWFNSGGAGTLVLTVKYMGFFVLAVASSFAGLGGGSAIAGGGLAIFGGLLGAIIMAVAAIVLLIGFVKILWLLLKTYVNILLQVALGPIQILLGTITPFGGFGAWLKGLAGNLAVYPVVGFMYVLSFFFLAQSFSALWPPEAFAFLKGDQIFPFGIAPGILDAKASWSPPFTFGEQFPGFLWLGASLAIMLLIPKAAEIIQGAISGKPFGFGTAIGESITGPFVTGIKTISTIYKAGSIVTEGGGLLKPKAP